MIFEFGYLIEFFELLFIYLKFETLNF